MRAVCEDALICDFAQYYHIYDLSGLKLHTAAVLACGLPPESRTIQKLTGQNIRTDQILYAAILDTLKNIEYLYVKRNFKGKHKAPESVLKKLTGSNRESEKNIKAFRSGEDFERERERILKG